MIHSVTAPGATSQPRTTKMQDKGLIDRFSLKAGPIRAMCVSAALVIAGLFGLSESKASTTIKINSYYYTCENSCIVSTRPGGGFSVWDSQGGHVSKTAAKGEAIVETGPAT